MGPIDVKNLGSRYSHLADVDAIRSEGESLRASVGDGEWQNKPHRKLYDCIALANRACDMADAKDAEIASLRAKLAECERDRASVAYLYECLQEAHRHQASHARDLVALVEKTEADVARLTRENATLRADASALDSVRAEWDAKDEAEIVALRAELAEAKRDNSAAMLEIGTLVTELAVANVQAQRQAIALEDVIGERDVLESEVKRLREMAPSEEERNALHEMTYTAEDHQSATAQQVAEDYLDRLARIRAASVLASYKECCGHGCLFDGLSTALIPGSACTGPTEGGK